jgi:hypothetical protein
MATPALSHPAGPLAEAGRGGTSHAALEREFLEHLFYMRTSHPHRRTGASAPSPAREGSPAWAHPAPIRSRVPVARWLSTLG